jgi:hypothetical protein
MSPHAFITRRYLQPLVWKPRECWAKPKQLTEAERQQREEELARQRQEEREPWAEEKRRLGL